MSRLYGRESNRLTIKDVRFLLKAFGEKSIASPDLGSYVSIVAIDRKRPLTLDNAMVVHFSEVNRKFSEEVKTKARKCVQDALKTQSSD